MLRKKLAVFVAIELALAIVGILLYWLYIRKKPYFEPAITIPGIGLSRQGMTEEVLYQRTEAMIETQVFTVLRDPRALEGVQRVTNPGLNRIFLQAGKDTGFPAITVQAIAFVESFGDPKAASPTGPKGIMQMTTGTAKEAGLKIYQTTHYRTKKESVKARGKSGKAIRRQVSKRIPYQVWVDERLEPAKAIPAAAKYLKRMSQKYGSDDLAVFIYHCGEGCMLEFKRTVEGIKEFKDGMTVPKLFFLNSPAYNRKLYELISKHMKRDESPRYWFTIRCAENLLVLYRDHPQKFKDLFELYRNKANPGQRAANRLWVWISPKDLRYASCEDIISNPGGKLVKAPDNPGRFGFKLRTEGAEAIAEKERNRKGHENHQQYFFQNFPATVGALEYIALETRRLHNAIRLKKLERYHPLDVTALVRPREYQDLLGGDNPNAVTALPMHCSGKVFDISYLHLPEGEKECLDFVLHDLGYAGLLGFAVESKARATYHIGPAPSADNLFLKIYKESVK